MLFKPPASFGVTEPILKQIAQLRRDPGRRHLIVGNGLDSSTTDQPQVIRLYIKKPGFLDIDIAYRLN